MHARFICKLVNYFKAFKEVKETSRPIYLSSFMIKDLLNLSFNLPILQPFGVYFKEVDRYFKFVGIRKITLM